MIGILLIINYLMNIFAITLACWVVLALLNYSTKCVISNIILLIFFFSFNFLIMFSNPNLNFVIFFFVFFSSFDELSYSYLKSESSKLSFAW